MLEDMLLLVAAVVIGACVGGAWYNIRKRPKTGSPKVTHVSLYIPTVFPPYALAMREPADDSQKGPPLCERDAVASRCAA
jgi:hypothetical protein